MQLAPGAVVGGKYRIEQALAKGGMGSVWIARHMQLGSPVAIKFLDASFAASAAHRGRFEREARASANLKSPHVVHVMDYGFEGDAPYLVMELLEGEDLGQRLHRVRRMSLRDTARVLTHVGKALRKAHEAGIAHRDLKPANLFIARSDDDEVVKVLDFGIAKESNSVLGDATRTGEVIGSPHYMSPEQVRAEKDLDYRTDLWSLGIILFRMLTGELPFPGDQLGPVLAKILTDPIPVPSRIAPDLPPSIDTFFARALARDKTQRYQSIGEMVEAFQNAAGGKDAFPSISMSLGTGAVPAAGGTAMWVPPGQTGQTSGGQHATGQHAPAIAQSGPHTGPQTGPYAGPITGTGPQGAPLAGSGPHTGPHGGPMMGPPTTGGLVSTGAPARPKSAAPVIAVAAIILVAAAGAAGAFFIFRGRSAEGASAASGAASVSPVPSEQASAAPSTLPTVAPEIPSATATATATAEPATTASASASSTSTAAKPAGTVRPKSTAAPAKTKEKWF